MYVFIGTTIASSNLIAGSFLLQILLQINQVGNYTDSVHTQKSNKVAWRVFVPDLPV